MNPRFRSENILAMELDMPDRVTFDFVDQGPNGGGAVPDPRAQAAIDAVLKWDRHSLLIFTPAGATGPLHLGPPRAAGGGSGGSGGGGGGVGQAAAAPAAAAARQRPPSAARGGRPASARGA
jgi:kinesin family protein 3/17